MRNRGVIPGLDMPSEELTSTSLLVGTAGTDSVARGQKRHNLEAGKSHSPVKQFLTSLT